MQIKRLVFDPAYLERMAFKGGAFFQAWTVGLLKEPKFARGVALDVIAIYGKRKPIPESIARVLEEIERRAQPGDLLKIVFTLGWMVGKGHERWKRTDPEAKRLLKAIRRKA